MKKCLVCCLLMFLLSGCARETFETVDDELLQPVMAPMGELSLALPETASQQVMENDAGDKLYLCGDYVLTLQTLEAGDTEKTIRGLCGFGSDSLTVIQTQSQSVKRYDWVWTSAGEGGDQLGRAAVLDDGSYHYCVTAMADAQTVATLGEEWDTIFSSLTLTNTQEP